MLALEKEERCRLLKGNTERFEVLVESRYFILREGGLGVEEGEEREMFTKVQPEAYTNKFPALTLLQSSLPLDLSVQFFLDYPWRHLWSFHFMRHIDK